MKPTEIALGIVSLVGLIAPADAASVANPKVIGPIPVTAKPGDPSHGYPFFSTTVDLACQGYVEEEFFFEGTANRYNTPELATGSVIDGGHRYRTRLVVRRPISPDKFNGTVVLEWQNVSGGYDYDGGWRACHDHCIRRGYAWIGVSAQRVGIHDPVSGLKAWSPRRYGTLDVTRDGTILDDALCFDIFSQAAQAVRKPTGTDPMGSFHVERVIATGASQSANRLVIYHNSIHPLAGVIDAFLLVVGGGRLRTDLGVKVFKLLSETDVVSAQAAIRQPDSDHFRSWEVAGSSHVDLHMAQAGAPLQARDKISLSSRACELPPFSRVPAYFVWNAALDHLVRWVKDNLPPPIAPGIALAAPGPPAVIARDRFGNALGGIRLAQHAVPTAVNSGLNSGPAFCRTYGSFQPFDRATLDALYPDHKTYVIQIIRATLENLGDGFIVPEDAGAAIWDAAHAQEFGGLSRERPGCMVGPRTTQPENRWRDAP